MEAAGWIDAPPAARPTAAPTPIELQPRAEAALDKAIGVSDRVQDAALAGFSAAERTQLVAHAAARARQPAGRRRRARRRARR